MELKEAEVHLTYRNKKTGETFKDRKEWEAKGGIGIHHTDVGKTIGELKRLGFK